MRRYLVGFLFLSAIVSVSCIVALQQLLADGEQYTLELNGGERPSNLYQGNRLPDDEGTLTAFRQDFGPALITVSANLEAALASLDPQDREYDF